MPAQRTIEALWDRREEGLKVLFAGADRADAALIGRLLQQHVVLARASSCPEALARADREAFDACLFDLQLGEASVLKFLRTLRAWGSALPVIVLATPAEDAVATEALREGACDYLSKASLTTQGLLRSLRYATQLGKAESSLRREVARYRSLFDRNAAGTFRLSLAGRLLDCNSSLLNALGYASREEALLGEGLQVEGAGGEERGQDWVLDLCATRTRVARVRRRDGSLIRVLLSAYLLEGEGGQPEAIEGTLVPVVGMEEVLAGVEPAGELAGQRSERSHRFVPAEWLTTLGQRVAGAMHDVNNLITAILGYSDLLLLDDLGRDERAMKRVREVRQAALRARALISRVLGMEGDREGGESTDLNGLVGGMRDLLRQVVGDRIELVLDLDSATPPVKLEACQLERVVTNLVLNARDAMTNGGRLVVGTGVGHPDPTVLAPGTYSVLTVIDSGIGMDPATQARIFEPFFTTKEQGKGTGLGLASVYDIVRQCGGWISLASEPGQGTRVEVWLPACRLAQLGDSR